MAVSSYFCDSTGVSIQQCVWEKSLKPDRICVFCSCIVGPNPHQAGTEDDRDTPTTRHPQFISRHHSYKHSTRTLSSGPRKNRIGEELLRSQGAHESWGSETPNWKKLTETPKLHLLPQLLTQALVLPEITAKDACARYLSPHIGGAGRNECKTATGGRRDRRGGRESNHMYFHVVGNFSKIKSRLKQSKRYIYILQDWRPKTQKS